VQILQNILLDPVLGIKDPRTDKRIDFIGGIRGTQELERLVASGAYQVAFSFYPTTIEQLIAVADADKIMPPSLPGSSRSLEADWWYILYRRNR